MITQLIQISTTPLKYELEIKRAKLEYEQEFIPQFNAATKRAKLDTKTENARVQLNSYEARRSLGMNNLADWGQKIAQQGMEAIGEATREHVDFGNEMSRINEGVTIAQIIEQKMLQEDQPVLYTAFLPSSGTEISWIPHKMEAEYEPGDLQYDWENMRNVMNYVPGSVRMIILQRPSIEIEYIGSPLYIPPSSSPDYVAPDE